MTTRKESKMTKRKLFEYGGMAAGVVLIAFGIGALLMSFDARSTTRDEIKREQIVGSEDMSPTAIQAGIDEAGLTGVEAPSCDVAGEPIDTGEEARCFAQYLRIHALESSGGLTYAEMGRFVSADDPENPAGTSDPEAALTDEEGNPVPNTSRNTWVTATALSTALNVSYMAEQLALFGIVVGVALILTGIGFLVLAIGGALRHARAEAPAAEKAALA
jgi:putative Mn2+ efflux pump MntP